MWKTDINRQKGGKTFDFSRDFIWFPFPLVISAWTGDQVPVPLPADTDALLHPGPSSSLTVQLLTNRAVLFCHLQVIVCGEQHCHPTFPPDFIHVGFLRKIWLDFSLLACRASAPAPKLHLQAGVKLRSQFPEELERVLYTSHLPHMLCTWWQPPSTSKDGSLKKPHHILIPLKSSLYGMSIRKVQFLHH